MNHATASATIGRLIARPAVVVPDWRQVRACRWDEQGRARCWRCGSILGDGYLGPGTRWRVKCGCAREAWNAILAGH